MSAKSRLLPSPTEASTPRRFERLLTGAFFTLTLSFTATGVPTNAAEVTSAQLKEVPAATTSVKKTQSSLPNGVYLYGQSAQANKIGSAYMVFKVTDRKIAGAFYMPSSSFDCFHGEIHPDRMALTVVDSYEQTSHPYAISLNTNARVANSARAGGAVVAPSGYHRIQTIDAKNHQMLATCLAQH